LAEPRILAEKCTGCGLCASACDCDALKIENNIVVFIPDSACVSCAKWCCQCEMVCPVGAIACPFDIVIEG